jgi:hypothetical protein
MESECFGLPHGGAIIGLVFGILIIVVGLGLFLQATGVNVNFWSIIWPIIIVIFGVLMVAGALYRRQRHTTPPP